MTESEWLQTSDPLAMLRYLVVVIRPPERKLRLLGEAVWGNGETKVSPYWYFLEQCMTHRPGLDWCFALRDVFGNPFRPIAYPRRQVVSENSIGTVMFGAETVFPPWYYWHDRVVPRIAGRIYEDRAFGDLPILADALLDAGCTDEALLAHCRGLQPCPKCGGRGWLPTPGSVWGPTMNCTEVATDDYPSGVGCAGSGWDEMRGPHVRGCWALDLLLGKT